MSLVFRTLTPADIPAVLEVRFSTRENAVTLEILRDHYGITPESLADALSGRVKGWLCEEHGKAVGFAMGDGATGEVQVVAVRPDHEGRGIGKRLLTMVQDWLFSEGHKEIWLLANPDPGIRASGFYRNLGWRKTGEIKGHDKVLKLSDADGGSVHGD